MKDNAKYRVIVTANFPDGTQYTKTGDYTNAKYAIDRANYYMDMNESNACLTYYSPIQIIKLDPEQHIEKRYEIARSARKGKK